MGETTAEREALQCIGMVLMCWHKPSPQIPLGQSKLGSSLHQGLNPSRLFF